jgi:hypothetical protein
MYFCGPCSVGIRIRVWWAAERKWVVSKLCKFDGATKMHSVIYDDGYTENLSLRCGFEAKEFAAACKTLTKSSSSAALSSKPVDKNLTEASLAKFKSTALKTAQSAITSELSNYLYAANYDPVNKKRLSADQIKLQLLNKFEADRVHNAELLQRNLVLDKFMSEMRSKTLSRSVTRALVDRENDSAITTVPNGVANPQKQSSSNKRSYNGQAKSSSSSSPSSSSNAAATTTARTTTTASSGQTVAPVALNLTTYENAKIWEIFNSNVTQARKTNKFAPLMNKIHLELGGKYNLRQIEAHFAHLQRTLTNDDVFHVTSLSSARVAPFLAFDHKTPEERQHALAAIQNALEFIACHTVFMAIEDDKPIASQWSNKFKYFSLEKADVLAAKLSQPAVAGTDVNGGQSGPKNTIGLAQLSKDAEGKPVLQCRRCKFFAPSVMCGPYMCSKIFWCEACIKVPVYFSGDLLREVLLKRPKSVEEAKVVVDGFYDNIKK